jgi:ribose-phosphate pyrophosphokinase
MAVIGDVKDKVVIIQDDMIDTAGTLTEAVNAIVERGAREVHACCAHPVMSGPAVDRINESPITSIVCTDYHPAEQEGGDLQKNQSAFHLQPGGGSHYQKLHRGFGNVPVCVIFFKEETIFGNTEPESNQTGGRG